MSKKLFIAEKPSVAAEFARIVGSDLKAFDGYREGESCVVTWCFGHLVTMSYPDAYDEKYRKWRLETLPFLPETFKYEVINSGSSKKQFSIVKRLLNRDDVDTIYVCTDSGREGEYIYRLVRQMAGVSGKDERRVWINSQTSEEIKRGIREAKPLSEYDDLSDAAYLRAKEDYLMGINFSRLLTLKYGRIMADFLGAKYCVVSVGRVMTCVLGMVTKREREIRNFTKTPFYKLAALVPAGESEQELEFEWKAVEGSRYFESPLLYRENGFKEEKDARALIDQLHGKEGIIESLSNRQEKKNAPLLYNLAELQNECSKLFKIAPDKTLAIVQELYEKKLVTYPRTDARVLSSAIAKEIDVNIKGLFGLSALKSFAQEIISKGSYKNIARTKYVNDSQITDHYAIIPTGKGLSALKSVDQLAMRVYEVIARRFLAIFLPQAVYRKVAAVLLIEGERFFAAEKLLSDQGYLAVMDYSFTKSQEQPQSYRLLSLKKGTKVTPRDIEIRHGETTPPKRYTTGSMILAMENAGNLIEDEVLREEIKGSGIGTSATRAEILDKLIKIDYLRRNDKTQVLTPSLQGEMVYYVVGSSIKSMLNPKLTAGWERGLSYVAGGEVTEQEYMAKLSDYIRKWTGNVLTLSNQQELLRYFQYARPYHEGESTRKKKTQKRKGKNNDRSSKD